MYNQEIAERLKATYGDEKFAIYVEMEVAKNKMISDDLKQLDGEEPDLGYDAFFWKSKYEELLKTPNH